MGHALDNTEVLLKEDGSARLIRRAEIPADYFATLDIDGQFSSLQEAACTGHDE